MTPAQIAQARAMLEAGQTRTQVAAHFGVTRYTLRRHLDPAYREATNQKMRERRQAMPVREKHVPEMPSNAKRDGERLLAQIPPDTRGFTARLMGDPLPHGDRHGRAGVMDYPWAVRGQKVTPVEGAWRGDARVDRPALGEVYTISDVQIDVDGQVCLLLEELVSSFPDAVYGYPARGFRPVQRPTLAQDVALFTHHFAQNGIQTSSPEPVA